MIEIREVSQFEEEKIDEIVAIHIQAFNGFFLSSLGNGFLKQLYMSYCEHIDSNLLIAEQNEKIVGFLAYSSNLSELYTFMIKKRLIRFCWYSVKAFFRKPSILMRLFRALLKPKESRRKEHYVELASIGVKPSVACKGIGSLLVDNLKGRIDFSKYMYINLETDAVDNNIAISFYEKNDFKRFRSFETPEGRKMYEYRYIPRTNNIIA